MVEFGLPTDLIVAEKFGIQKSIERVKNLGFNFVEIFLEPPFDGIWKPKEIKKILDDTNFKALGHFTWYADLSSWYDDVRRAWIKVCKRAIDFFSEAEIEYVTFHTNAFIKYPYLKSKKDVFVKNLVSSLKELEIYARNKNITILLENAGEKWEITDLDDYQRIIDNLDYTKINLDIGHAFANNHKEKIFSFIKRNEGILYHLHFHDNNLKDDEHLPPGKGKIPWKEVVRILKKIGYNRTITLEIFGDDNMLKNSLCFISNIFETV